MAPRTDVTAMLAKVPLFQGLDSTATAAVADAMRDSQFEPGQTIFSRGDPGTEMHIVVKGRVRLSVLTGDGRELSFAHVETPSIFGELAVFDGLPRSADATAVNRVETLTLSRPAFKQLLAATPEVAEAALSFISKRLRAADQQLEAIALHPIEVRLARFFLTTARQKDPDGKKDTVTLALPISQSELALLVGASRPKVNAALSLLEADGAIERRGQQIVCDMALLTERGGLE